MNQCCENILGKSFLWQLISQESMTLHKSFHATDPNAVYDEGKLQKIELKINCRVFILISSPYQPNLIIGSAHIFTIIFQLI